jgi:hypothetical protein
MKLELLFGSGTGDTSDELVTLNSTQIANSKYNQVISNSSLDPADFISTNTFGVAPANTTLTVTYLVGGGIQSNVASNTIRQNALAFFNAQNRVVTDKDYLVRSYAMPAQFGSVSKVFVVRDEQINAIGREDSGSLVQNNNQNPFDNRTYVVDPVAPNAINLYVLGYDENKNLATLNTLVKKNLAKYLEQYRVLTDDVNILDAFVVNIAVEFHIVVYRNYNMNDGRDYFEYRYPIEEAIVDDIIYPSLDPCIFEIRHPETDIVGFARQ